MKVSVWDRKEGESVTRSPRTLPRVRTTAFPLQRPRVHSAPAEKSRVPSVTPEALSLMRKALRPGLRILRKREIAPRKSDLLLSLSLSSGLLFLCQVAIAFAIVHGIAAVAAPERTPLHLPLQHSITDAQAQLFLSALLELPDVAHVAYVTKEQAYERLRREAPEHLPFLERYVAENPLVDTVDIGLRSLPASGRFLAFLKRPELQTVLDPTFLWEVEAWRSTVGRAIADHRALSASFSAAALFILLLTALVVLQTLGAPHCALWASRGKRALALLSGAEFSSLRRPFFLESVVLLGAGLLLGTLLAAAVFLLPAFNADADILLPLFKWILPVEALLFFGIAYLLSFRTLPDGSHARR